MPSSLFSSAARWIWSDDAVRSYHNTVCFRRTFDVAGDATDARLLITADARYEVWLNGEWLGHGPARAWQSPWPVDPYDVRDMLRSGRNVIAVRVQHFGIGTFQYLAEAPGLIAELAWTDASGAQQLASDDAWKARSDAGFLWPVPRISCQQAWEEQFDARVALQNWMCVDFADAEWPMAKPVQAAGEGAHAEFALRDIPQLTREPVSPVRVRAVEAVKGAPYQWTLNPREFLHSHDKAANHLRGNLLLMTHIYSERAQTVSFHPPHGRPEIAWKLNGKLLAFDDHFWLKTDTGVAHARLKAGWNTLMGPLPPDEHFWWAVLNAWTDQPVRWSAYPDDRDAATAWLAVGPFGNPDDFTPPPPTGFHKVMTDALTIPAGATLAQFEAIRERGVLQEGEYGAAYVRPLTRDMVAATDVYALCSSERVVGKLKPRTEHIDTVLHDTAEWAVLHPVEGADVRVLLDFGREVIGYHEFEVDAPAGTIIDNHNFEFIQPDGRFNLTEGMNNSFRYVCREGVQRYRTLVRRGFQYSWFSFRNFDRPVRVRFIRVLMSTYPQARQGAFACSDVGLDRIWEVGAHSVRCCSEDTYTDCPTYEQTFWVGDARNEALVDFVVNGDPRLSAHSWSVAAQSLNRSAIVESQVPSAWENILPTWSMLWMRWAQEHHQFSGDDTQAREMVRALARNIAGIEGHLSERGLFAMRSWNLFDWAPMDTPADGEVTHLNALTVLGLRQAATLADNIGEKAKAKAWRKLADGIANAINRYLWDEKKRAYVDCIRGDGTRSPVYSQQTHTAICIAGVAAGERLKRSRAIMEKAPKGFVKAGSPFFMFFLLEGLANEGRYTELVDTVRAYWGKQVDAGATTFWETYHPGEERLTRSHCHGWSAAPTFFLSQHVLGVQPLEPGFSTVRIAPQLCGLEWARGRVPTPRGAVSVVWRYESKAKCFALTVDLPAGAPAVIELPVSGKLAVVEGKVSKLTAPKGALRLRTTSTRVRLVVT
ncbi:MAG: family 78 glycoside hydrolase catalytic domain [Opitutaceae bacterium]|jgi:hypothetical protein